MEATAVRVAIKAKRKALSLDYQHNAAKAFADQFKQLPAVPVSQHVACYLPVNGEADTSSIIQWLWYENKHVYLPKVQQDQSLCFANYSAISKLSPNRFGIAEPQAEPYLSAHELDIVICPLVAFDKRGNRLGMGAGYYDRSFAFKLKAASKKPLLIGLAYEFQQVTELVQKSWDVPLNAAITEKQTIFFNC